MLIKQEGTMFYCGEYNNPSAKITFYYHDNSIVVDHTYVSTELRGKKIGQKLVEQIVLLAKKEQKLIYPKCSFAKKELERNYENINLIYKGTINKTEDELNENS